MNEQIKTGIISAANEAGFVAEFSEENSLFTFTESDSGISITSVFQGEDDDETSILYNQMSVGVIPESQVSVNPRSVINLLIGATNGISTSSFQTIDTDDGDLQVLLNNYAPIQDMGQDDIEDIKFTLTSLIADLFAAHDMLAPYMSEAQTHGC